jgi:hypothetical protein
MEQLDSRFEAECGECRQHIVTSDGGGTWRHDKAPADKHGAYASGLMRQI